MPNYENNDLQNETWTNIDTRKGIGIKRARKAPNTKKKKKKYDNVQKGGTREIVRVRERERE